MVGSYFLQWLLIPSIPYISNASILTEKVAICMTIIAKVDYCKLTVFVGAQNWQGGPVLAAKNGLGDQFWQRTDFFITGVW